MKEIKELREYLNQYKEHLIDYLMKAYDEYHSLPSGSCNENRKARLAYVEKYGKVITQLCYGRCKADFEERATNLANDDAESKYNGFIRRVEKVGGEISNPTTLNLSIGNDGSLNGWILCDNGKVKVTTILAWGEIIRPHYRVLVHLFK